MKRIFAEMVRDVREDFDGHMAVVVIIVVLLALLVR